MRRGRERSPIAPGGALFGHLAVDVFLRSLAWSQRRDELEHVPPGRRGHGRDRPEHHLDGAPEPGGRLVELDVSRIGDPPADDDGRFHVASPISPYRILRARGGAFAHASRTPDPPAATMACYARRMQPVDNDATLSGEDPFRFPLARF